MNERENYLAYLKHDNTEWIPNIMDCACFCGGDAETFENGPAGGGVDGFGVKWVATHSASGQAVPEPNHIVLKDVTAWEDMVKFPDLDSFDWKGLAERQLGKNKDGSKVVEYHSWNSQFLRLTHLMGFEGALCAMYEEPEACNALMSAITDYKIRIIERVHDYFNPDSFVNYDDVATVRGLFMSPKTYRELIKPHHKRMNDAAIAYGMIPQQHCCGKCEELIPDFIDEGAAAWQSAQPDNDIAGIIQKYGDRIGVTGGYDSQGRPGAPDATIDEIKVEVDRCMNEYGQFGKGYCFMGILLNEADDQKTLEKLAALMDYVSQVNGKNR